MNQKRDRSASNNVGEGFSKRQKNKSDESNNSIETAITIPSPVPQSPSGEEKGIAITRLPQHTP